jgi:hypothetical protein
MSDDLGYMLMVGIVMVPTIVVFLGVLGLDGRN